MAYQKYCVNLSNTHNINVIYTNAKYNVGYDLKVFIVNNFFFKKFT